METPVNSVTKLAMTVLVFCGIWGAFGVEAGAASLEESTLVARGAEFATFVQKQDLKAARGVFKRAMREIQESPTSIMRLEQWFQKQPRFATMLGEAYTVAAAIAAAEVFLHGGESGLGAKDVVYAIGMSAGIVAGSYLPYRIAADYLENRKNKRLLQQFLAGIESVMPLPESPERLSAWLVEIAGASPSSQFCARLLSP